MRTEHISPRGTIEQTREVRALDVKLFTGSEVHFAELDASVRETPSFVSFLLNGTMRANPEEGTILNIDGAVIGFREQPARVEGEAPKQAELVTLNLDETGAAVWEGTRFYLSLRGDEIALRPSPRMCVRLDHTAHSWTLYFRDIVVAEDLPLFAMAEEPMVTIRAGLPGDEAWLKELKVRAAPPKRGPAFPPTETNGRVDLEKAYVQGDPRVMRLEVGPAGGRPRSDGPTVRASNRPTGSPSDRPTATPEASR